MIPKKPINSTWTDEQWNAIYQNGSNIIVSAGAGSGKTAVLTERIIEKLKQGISISSLVVLTFTKAAAFEMKTRVRKKLKKEIENGNTELEKELERLNQASITTFDSYSLSLVKKYHYLLGIKKDITIADNVVLEKKKKELIDDVFCHFYEKKDPLFLKLLDTFTIKDDEMLKSVCLKLNDSLESLAHKKEYLNEYFETHYHDLELELRISQYEQLLEVEKKQISNLLESLKNSAYHNLSIEFVNKVASYLEPLFSCHHYDDYKAFIGCCTNITFPRSKKIEESELFHMKLYYEQIKDHIERIKELCIYENKENLKESVMKTKETVQILISILKKYDEQLLQYKMNEGMYEFSDIARLAITLLEEHSDICETLKQEISEIMIDEYQDTNDIGDYFISLISNNNVYMVGDIKQSIYRFRNANPSIFMDKYNRYKNHQDGEKIDLNRNFRSRREVLDDINFLFEKIMDEEIGGADYCSGHAMVFGNDSYEKEGATNQNYHFEILNYEYKDTELSKYYRTEEVEAFLIAQDIKNKVQNHYQVYDKDNRILRDIQYQDFSILLDRKTSFDLYKKIFTYLEIPLTVHKEEAFVYSDEIFVIQNIMRWIQSILDKNYAKDYLRYAVASISRSVIARIPDEKLFELLMEHKENLLEALDDETCIVYEIHQNMKSLAEYSKTHTLSQFLEQVYHVFDLYHYILSLHNIEVLNIKLDYLLDVTRNLEKMGYQILDFIDYLKEAIEGKSDVTFQMNQDTKADSVNLMSIHKSKGLEYHICYYAGLQKKFSKADLKEKFIFSGQFGFIVPYFDEGIRETFYKELLKEDYQKEDISERIRVFYVALSRAKEKMILVTNLGNLDSNTEKNENGLVESYVRMNYRSFYDILLSISLDLKPYTVEVPIDTIPLTKEYEKLKETNYQDSLTCSQLKPHYIELLVEPEKIEKKHFSESYHVVDAEEQKRLELGIKLHECLQYTNYHDIENSLSKMSLSEYARKKLLAFFHQDFWKSMDHPECYPELEFVETIDNKEISGMIDLLIVDTGCAYIVDYKLKNIEKSSYEEQIRGYAKVIEKRIKKPVKGMLYSLLDETYREIKI